MPRSYFYRRFVQIHGKICIFPLLILLSFWTVPLSLVSADPDSAAAPQGRWYFTNPQASPCGIFPDILKNSGFDVADPALINNGELADIDQDDPHTSPYETAYLTAMHKLFFDQNDASICAWHSRTNPTRDNLQVTVFHWSSSSGPDEANALRVAELNMMKVINCQFQLPLIKHILARRERAAYAFAHQQTLDRIRSMDNHTHSLPHSFRPGNRSEQRPDHSAPIVHKPERPMMCTPEGPMFVEQHGAKKQYLPVNFHYSRWNPRDHRPQPKLPIAWPIEDFTLSIFGNPVHFSSGIYGCTASSDLGLFVMATGYSCDKLAKMLEKVVQP